MQRTSEDRSKAGAGQRNPPLLPPLTFAGFLLAVVTIAVISGLTWWSREGQIRAGDEVVSTLDRLHRQEELLSTLKDAESGQRGFLMTAQEAYLAPYESARTSLPEQLAAFTAMVQKEPEQLERLTTLRALIKDKFEELDLTIRMVREGQREKALEVVRSNRGKAAMDATRQLLADMRQYETNALDRRNAERQEAILLVGQVTGGGAAVLLVLIVLAAYVASRDYRASQREAWLRAGQGELSLRMQGDLRLDQLGESTLSFLAGYLQAQVGAAYLWDGRELRRFGAWALGAAAADRTLLRAGDGLAGQALRERKPLHVTAVPAGYLPVSSSVGEGTPAQLLIVPVEHGGAVQAVIELGFTRPVGEVELELLRRASEPVAVAVRGARDRTRLEELLQETQRQSEELQTQQEELRVSNEELEEQGNALRESTARLEAQQAELEQTNSQLEEQMRQLEEQKEELTAARESLQERARELAQASQYKSEFLANMSHELRTPLNSSLILAKLLADNPSGNLTDEQVKFAQTISSAGNDLLVLINDILDLSKIEAGKLDVNPEPVEVSRVLESLERTFRPLARERKLALTLRSLPGAPARLETDPQRLQQVLKNLLSNALKFTEKGEVAVEVAPHGDELTFNVRDTGIGIPAAQQGLIFEAFRQADGSTHRKYGGTGLGLTISRDLARLLGGDLRVESTPGQGSTFVLSVPLRAPAPGEAAALAPKPVLSPAPAPATFSPPPLRGVPPPEAPARQPEPARPSGHRLILVIEDDARFAEILKELAQEQQFDCLVAGTADEGVRLAREHLPSAILLDMNLPDHSGLSVLDQLKRRPATRHIPVHVMSVEDHTQAAMEMGAVGYARKPVDRERLLQAFGRLESKLAQTLRNVLVVEDDDVQRDSVRRLLESEEVKVTAVPGVADAQAALRERTFDCMVMDLSLKDASGFELLESMAREEGSAFPPVIVYTGRSLSAEEEQRLRRFSRSIIIKGAHSPERLLDEVTLFLHQVESKLPADQQRMLHKARNREAAFEGKRILVVEDDVRNVFALSSILEPKGAKVEIARNGREAIDRLGKQLAASAEPVDLVLMDIMMPEMDGLTAMREIRKRNEWRRLPIIALTAKAMRDDHESCLAAGANDYIAKPLDVEKLLSLVRVWMPK